MKKPVKPKRCWSTDKRHSYAIVPTKWYLNYLQRLQIWQALESVKKFKAMTQGGSARMTYLTSTDEYGDASDASESRTIWNVT